MGEDLVRAHLPHAPGLGLWVAPEIPPKKLAGALGDYARGVRPEEVLALYDATLFGSAKDGVVFLADRLVTQANDLEAPRTIPYDAVVGVDHRRKVLGGRTVRVQVGRGKTVVTETLDFAAHPGAAPHVAAFLEAALLREPPSTAVATDRAAVVSTLDRLVAEGRLAPDDRRAMLRALGSS